MPHLEIIEDVKHAPPVHGAAQVLSHLPTSGFKAEDKPMRGGKSSTEQATLMRTIVAALVRSVTSFADKCFKQQDRAKGDRWPRQGWWFQHAGGPVAGRPAPLTTRTSVQRNIACSSHSVLRVLRAAARSRFNSSASSGPSPEATAALPSVVGSILSHGVLHRYSPCCRLQVSRTSCCQAAAHRTQPSSGVMAALRCQIVSAQCHSL